MTISLRQLGPFLWEIPRQGGMKVPGRVYVAPRQIEGLRADKSLEQVVNVAHLPGIVGASLAMPATAAFHSSMANAGCSRLNKAKARLSPAWPSIFARNAASFAGSKGHSA